MRFVHCSDVHITGDYFRSPLRLGWRRWVALLELTAGGRARAFREAPATLAAISGAAEREGAHLVVSGDLTAYALEEEFEGARRALGAPAGDPRRCTVVPGNHDTFTRGSVRSQRFQRHFGHLLHSDLPEHQREGAFPFVRLLGEGEDRVAVVGLCSARLPPMPGLSYGRIGAAQLEGLSALLADPRLEGRAVLVVVHHAPLTRLQRADRAHHGLVDASALLALLQGPRFAVLHGHIHQRYHHPATATRPHLFGAGSSTQAGHQGYWVIETQRGMVLGGKSEAPVH
ncbi:metallophosphoesterase [Aggregicoccus sp. 17bor-14]|uniref:metallophosphoesterase family protein n=1 Tax=Myxococcaceae TaxID=31 RepID=UPI00129CF194|nr:MULTISPECIES: metallophosphoesterase [Myxococcaceae]MBF5043587.1 metallophosphoesterase [Simulacricoccus sp. 17bor-14]MRI89346.1 metallophosphoesterase [Aggregicoccus sp. 17bor-14]